MKLVNALIAAMILTGMLDASAAIAAGGDKNSASQRGGKAAEHMSAKGALNTNAQWSADPERGWIRAEERHQQQQKRGTSADPKQTVNNGKPKGKVKANKF